jgi:hypothetical protein
VERHVFWRFESRWQRKEMEKGEKGLGKVNGLVDFSLLLNIV